MAFGQITQRRQGCSGDIPGRRIAVSLTPLPLEADSRAFRVAGSLADAGFRSIVIEGGLSSRRFWDDTVEVRSAGRLAGGSTAFGHGNGMKRLHGVAASLRGRRLGAVGEEVLYIGFRGYEWWRHCYRLARLVPAAEIYYLHSFELYRVVAPLVRRLGARIVYDAHDFYRGIEPSALQHSFDRKRLSPFLDRLERRLVAVADAVVTVSDGVASLIEDAFGRRPVVIRNCHDAQRDRPSGHDLRQVLGLAPADRLCVIVGNWKPGMAVGVAADALAYLPERFHLAFLGRGYDRVVHKLRSDLLGRRLHIGCVVAPNEVVPSIRSADIGLVIYEPYSENYRYALPNGFFQIIAAGLPIVRAPLPEIEATIGHRPVGVCLTRLDPVTLARAIMRCADDAEAHRIAAAELARELRWATESIKLQQLIDGLLARRLAPDPCKCGHRTNSSIVR